MKIAKLRGTFPFICWSCFFSVFFTQCLWHSIVPIVCPLFPPLTHSLIHSLSVYRSIRLLISMLLLPPPPPLLSRHSTLDKCTFHCFHQFYFTRKNIFMANRICCLDFSLALCIACANMRIITAMPCIGNNQTVERVYCALRL